MMFWSLEGLLAPSAKGKCLLGPNLDRETKGFLDGSVGALPRVLKAYIGEAVWLPNPPEAKQQGLPGCKPKIVPTHVFKL